MLRFKLFFVFLFVVLTSLQGQDLVTRYIQSSHSKENTWHPDFTKKVEKLSKHRALAFEVEGGQRVGNTNKFRLKYNGTRNFNIIARLGVKQVPGYNQNITYWGPNQPQTWEFYNDVYGKSLKKQRYNGYIMWSTDTTYKFKNLTVEAPRYNAFGERTGSQKGATKIKSSTSKVVIAGESFKDQTFDIAPGAGVNDGKSYFNETELRTKGVFRLDQALVGKTVKVEVKWKDSTGWESVYELEVEIY